MKKKLHWICLAPSPFHAHFFRAMAQEPDVELMVHFADAQFSGHPWKSTYAGGFESRTFKRRFGVDWTLVGIALRGNGDLLLVPGWSDATSRLVSGIGRLPFGMWTDTPRVDAHRPLLKRLVRDAWVWWIFRRARYLLSTGRPGTTALRRMGASDAKVVNLPFFVPIADRDQRAVMPTGPDDVVRFCSVGRLINRYKGFDFALEALAAARKATGRENFRYVLAGAGPDENVLRRRAAELGIGHLVEFAGWLEAADTAALLRRSHVLLHPARQDAFPLAVLDAMANGVVVFGSDAAGSVADRVAHGVNGFVHSAGDVDALARHIQDVLTDPASLGPMGERAWATAAEWPVARGVEIVKALLNGR